MIKMNRAALGSIALAIPLAGCGVLASNGLDYSSYAIPKLPEAAPAPPPPAPCQMPEAGQPVSLEGCKTGDTIVLHGVNFDFNKATLTLNAKSLLDQVAGALVARPDIKVEVEGHTDGKGGDAYNQRLSEARAESVEHYLAGHGVDPARMSARGFGKTMPIADNSTDEGREQNRRVELKVLESAMPAMPAAAAAPVEDKHAAIVVLEPLPAHANEPGAGIPTSIGVLTHVPDPKEAGPTPEYKNQPPMTPDAPKAGPDWKAPAGSNYTAPAATTSMAMPMGNSTPAPSVSYNGSAVAIANYAFTPSTLVVAPGTTVTWTNKDNVTHTVKFTDQNQTIASGQSFSKTFSSPGEYRYQCGIHPSMQGKIVVQ